MIRSVHRLHPPRIDSVLGITRIMRKMPTACPELPREVPSVLSPQKWGVPWFLVMVDLAKAFRKGFGTALLLTLLPPAGLPSHRHPGERGTRAYKGLPC